MQNERRSFLALAAKLVLGAVLFFLVISRVPMAEVWTAARGVPPATIVLLIVLYFAGHTVNAVRLHVLLPGLSLKQAWRFTMIAILFGTALPGQLSGDAVKAFRLARAAGNLGEVTHAIAAVAVDRIVSMFALLILTALGIGLNAGTFGKPLEAAAGAVTILMPLALLIGFAAPLPPWLGRIGAAFASWREAALSPRVLVVALALGFLFQALSIASVIVLGHALGIVLSWSVWCVVVGLVSTVLLLPVTIAGLGLREGSLIAVLSLLGQSKGAALALSLGLLALTLLGALVGLIADVSGRDTAR